MANFRTYLIVIKMDQVSVIVINEEFYQAKLCF